MTSRIRTTLVSALTGLALAAGMLVGSATTAAADDTNPPPETVTITAKVVGSAIASAKATASASASASSYAAAAAWAHTSAQTTSKCFWTPGTNSYYSGGKLIPFYDNVPAYVCKLKHAIHKAGKTWTYKKIKGGTSGSPCGNLFIPGHHPVKKVTVLDVKVGTTAKVAVSATADVTVAVAVNVTLEYTYNGETKTLVKSASASDSGHDSKKATASVKVTKTTTVKSSAAVITKAKASVKAKATASAKAKATASAKAKAVASVSVTITIVVPNKPPTGDFILPEHLYVGGTYCAKFFGSDPEDGSNVQMTTTISELASFVNQTDNCAYRDNTENTQRVITQPIQAGSTPGTVTVTLEVKDSKGLTSGVIPFTFPVLADDFPGDGATKK